MELEGHGFGMMTILPARSKSSQARSQPIGGQSRALEAAIVAVRVGVRDDIRPRLKLPVDFARRRVISHTTRVSRTPWLHEERA